MHVYRTEMDDDPDSLTCTIMAMRKTRGAWDTREKFAFRPARPVSPIPIHC